MNFKYKQSIVVIFLGFLLQNAVTQNFQKKETSIIFVDEDDEQGVNWFDDEYEEDVDEHDFSQSKNDKKENKKSAKKNRKKQAKKRKIINDEQNLIVNGNCNYQYLYEPEKNFKLSTLKFLERFRRFILDNILGKWQKSQVLQGLQKIIKWGMLLEGIILKVQGRKKNLDQMEHWLRNIGSPQSKIEGMEKSNLKNIKRPKYKKFRINK